MRKTFVAIFIVFGSLLLFGGVENPAETAPDGMIEAARPLAPAPAASAWRPIGPFGGSVQALAGNWKHPNEIYTATGSVISQFFKSTNSAKNWTRTAILV